VKFKQFQFLKQEAIKKLILLDTEDHSFVSKPASEVLASDAVMLAYIGDAVYSMYIRQRVVEMSISKVQVLHTLVTEFICAKSQSKVLDQIESMLTEDEQIIARRARNSNVNVPKSSSVREYRNSTAFEAVLGFLYETGQQDRLNELMKEAYSITLRGPVKEALKAGRSIQRILVSDDKVKTGLSDIVGLAKSKGVEVRPTPVKQMNRYETDVPHQGVIAFVNAVEFKDLGEVLQESNHENPLLILTDGVEDPHNMGAIIRTAECVGATAVLIPKRHNAPINATVAKTSAGAVEQIPLVQVGNVTQTIKQLQKQGFWVLGAHMDGDRTLYEADLTISTVLVIGNEGKGISRVVKEACDFLVTIPMYGNLNSLNASVAAAILMYEAVRQRTMKVK